MIVMIFGGNAAKGSHEVCCSMWKGILFKKSSVVLGEAVNLLFE
jgi:hypothetical protein